jgi:hypothetical protein
MHRGLLTFTGHVSHDFAWQLKCWSSIKGINVVNAYGFCLFWK